MPLQGPNQSRAGNHGGEARRGLRRRERDSTAPHADSKEACAGSPDAGMQDGGGAGPATRAAGGDGKRAARVRPKQHRGREGYRDRESSVSAPGQPEIQQTEVLAMRMYRCDRCGELVTSSCRSFIRKPSRGVYRFGKKQHLCPDCADDLRRWLKMLKFADTGALREVVAEIEEADVDGTGDWAERIRKAVGL
nr:MAG TPA: hypothetical protein [Bacteriophage sp.]